MGKSKNGGGAYSLSLAENQIIASLRDVSTLTSNHAPTMPQALTS